MPDPNPTQLLTPDELCAWLRIERRPLYRLIARRAIPHIKIGHRLRFDRHAITTWLDHQRHDPTPRRPMAIATPRPRPQTPPAPHLIPFDHLLPIDPGAG